MPHDVSVVIVSSPGAPAWLTPCLSTVYAHAGDVDLDVVVVENDGSGTAVELVEEHFPAARTLQCDNHGFAHANNRAAMTCDARYLLFLNPDTEILEGTIAELVRRMDQLPDVGLAGCRQLAPDGALWATMRRFPSVRRQLAEALGCERFPATRALGERVLELERYDHEFDGDWTAGSCMLVRREALEGAGLMDERFFLYLEETDLALRIRQAGWRVRHLPQLALVHHVGRHGFRTRAEAQAALSRVLYARKHFSAPRARAYLAAYALRSRLRRAALRLLRRGGEAVPALTASLDVLAGRAPAPYEPVPPTAVRQRATLDIPAVEGTAPPG